MSEGWTPDPARAQPSRVGRRKSREARARRKRGRAVALLAGSVVVILILVLGFVFYKKVIDKPAIAADYAGPGGAVVVVEVAKGDTAREIATAMADKDVVASWEAFYEAAVANPDMGSVMPGYYAMPSQIPAAEAVTKVVDPATRVGALVISEGRQLHDSRDVNTDAVKEGIYTKIAKASCIEDKCVTYDQLNEAGAASDLDSLGVPEWAQDSVRKVPDRDRQLEGLLAAGSLDFDPTGTPTQILSELVTDSVAAYTATGILESGSGNLSPYQLLVAASLVERESKPEDFGKVARVILNRLKVNQPLQFDSTVNYALDKTEVATTDADREAVTPWNTYAMPGLPATPISSPSIAALQAMENPTEGNWLYFVTVDKEGTTVFTDSYEEHLRSIERALESGILDSGR
ncbi:endolytic transglycosylase MltG [Antrihabitans stalagmiti]|uniref:endolytic transglycosylase MltG n=1 Tax=Antrihabitans stalagmiti TaxID=2799499 RepID=UPI0027DB81AA|nr:endolytic transglycosylase MltG [Antrihabitans stalagmiti]